MLMARGTIEKTPDLPDIGTALQGLRSLRGREG
jgi:hypothetical protein